MGDHPPAVLLAQPEREPQPPLGRVRQLLRQLECVREVDRAARRELARVLPNVPVGSRYKFRILGLSSGEFAQARLALIRLVRPSQGINDQQFNTLEQFVNKAEEAGQKGEDPTDPRDV